MNKKIFLILLILVLLQVSYAQKNSIKLLAVNDATKQGVVVDLDLNVADGENKVFVETQPLSQIDTQISLRIAKMIACKTSEVYCLNKDFSYSIKASSPIIAGPSAGAAITILTMASLENKKIDADVVITGTINSGGVIGVVGGVKEKVEAASKANLKKVLIPKGELNTSELDELRKENNITVIEISNIDDAYEIFTNEKIESKDIEIDQKYEWNMKKMNEDICERTKLIISELEKYNISNNSIKELGMNLSEKAEDLYDEGKYYSSASRCFGANVYLKETLFKAKNITEEEINNQTNDIEKELNKLDNKLNQTKITNLGDLEAVMIIRERIYDAKKNLEEAKKNGSLRDLSYATERTYSSSSWENFLGFSGRQIDISKLKESCTLKINEVQELYNYVSIYMPSLLEETKKELDSTKEYATTGDYALCLFKAAKAQAEIDVALSTLYVSGDNVDYLLENKILAAKKAIEKQIEKETFPILGYSYYEYAMTLNNTDKFSALLYAEYGIELSNLDIYFPQKKPFEIKLDEKALLTLILGLAMGALIFLRKPYQRRRIRLK